MALLQLVRGATPAVSTGPVIAPGKFYAQGPSGAKRIALTFDDGPGPETEKFIALLHRYKVRSTFFVQGGLVPSQTDTVKKLVAYGHEIGSHTSTHINYNAHQKGLAKKTGNEAAAQAQAEKDLIADMRRSHAAITAASGRPLTLCRMPNGIDRPWIRDAARQVGYTLINWSYGADWNKGTAEELLPGYLKAIRPGAILLFHDGGKDRSRTLTIVDAVIRSAREKGYEMVTVSELLQPPR